MTTGDVGWTANPFVTDVEHRADGSFLLRPRASLAAYPRRTMDQLEHWARLTPDRVLVARRGPDGAWITVTYRQMLARVRRVAAGLVTRKLSPERPIVVFSGNSIEHLIVAFAAAYAGIPYTPVSPSYSLIAGDLGKLQHVLQLLTPGMVVAFETRKFERALRELVPADVEVIGDEAEVAGRRITSLDALAAEPSAALEAAHEATGPDTIAKFFLTSGSTGTPKAVIVTERMLCSNAVMLREALPFVVNEPPVLVDWLPWNHTFGGNHNIDLVLFNGGSLYINDGKPTPQGFAETLRNLREISPTLYLDVPKGFEMLAHTLEQDAALRRQFYSRLRAYFFAGAGLSQHTWDVLDALALKEQGVRIPMLSGLGATETGPSVTFTTPAMGRAGVIGLPAAGNEIKLVPVEGKLELRVRSPSVTPGYWRAPELTRAAFDEQGFYCLGDAVKLLNPEDPTAGLAFDGRIAEDFKLASGTWVSVGPLRAALIHALAPLVQDVVIAGLNQDYLTALLIPDVRACQSALDAPGLSQAELAVAGPMLERIRGQLQTFAKQHPASSTHVQRALVLSTPPSLGEGEITDKGSINQRAILRCRSGLVEGMYQDPPSSNVVVI